jgi:hypothetical protein
MLYHYVMMLYVMSNIRQDIPYLVRVSLLGGWLNTTVTLMLTSPLPYCTRATCLIVSRPVWQYNSCYSFVDMLQKLERKQL